MKIKANDYRIFLCLFVVILGVIISSCTVDTTEYNEREFVSSHKDYSLTATDYWTELSNSGAYDISLYHGASQAVYSSIYYLSDLSDEMSLNDLISAKIERFSASYSSFDNVYGDSIRSVGDKKITSSLFKASTADQKGYVYINAIDLSKTDGVYILVVQSTSISDFSKHKSEFDDMVNSVNVTGTPVYSNDEAQKVEFVANYDNFKIEAYNYWIASKNVGSYDLWIDYDDASMGAFVYKNSTGEQVSAEGVLEAQTEKISKIFDKFELFEESEKISENGKTIIGSTYLTDDGSVKCYIRLNVVYLENSDDIMIVFIETAPVTMFDKIKNEFNDILTSVTINN